MKRDENQAKPAKKIQKGKTKTANAESEISGGRLVAPVLLIVSVLISYLVSALK